MQSQEDQGTGTSTAKVGSRKYNLLHLLTWAKCDQLTPSCSQCKRTGRSCEGYRDYSDLQIRDQSQDVAAKHSASRRLVLGKKRISPVSDNSIVSRPQPSKPTYVPPSLIPAYIRDSPEDIAACFFFNEYVLEDSTQSHNLFDAVPTYYSHAPVGSAISKAVVALGMACLSNTMCTPDTMFSANKYYVEALSLINFTLRCSERSKSDQTLLIVILLGLFEEVLLPLSASEFADKVIEQ